MARNSTVHIAVSEEKKRELKDFAERYGITLSALGAYIIGQWIDSQKRYVAPVLDAFQSEVRERIRDVLKDEA
jgi:hypothetical protein